MKENDPPVMMHLLNFMSILFSFVWNNYLNEIGNHDFLIGCWPLFLSAGMFYLLSYGLICGDFRKVPSNWLIIMPWLFWPVCLCYDSLVFIGKKVWRQ